MKAKRRPAKPIVTERPKPTRAGAEPPRITKPIAETISAITRLKCATDIAAYWELAWRQRHLPLGSFTVKMRKIVLLAREVDTGDIHVPPAHTGLTPRQKAVLGRTCA